MKGISLFADILSVFVLLAFIMFSILIIWSLIVIHQVELVLGITSPRTVTLTIFYLPSKYDAMLLSFLEVKEKDVSMKKIIEAAAIQESYNVWLEGKEFDLKTLSNNFFSSRINKPLIFKITLPKKEIIILDSMTYSQVGLTISQEASTKLFLLNGEVADLKLLVRD